MSNSSPDRFKVRRRRRRVARRRLAGVVLVVVLAAGFASTRVFGGRPTERVEAAASPGRVELRALGRVVAEVDAVDAEAAERMELQRWRRTVLRRIPSELRRRTAGATVLHRVDRRPAVRDALAAGSEGGAVQVPVRAVESRIAAPVVAQKLRNNCETAALEILLATVGVQAGQLELQEQLDRSGPLDPVETPRGRVWGDPERGYVGRAEGGGVAGGFGVYERPIRALAKVHGRGLEDVGGASVATIYDRLLEGRAVMAWIGLSEGPYGEWRSPEGNAVRVNFGEHTVVLAGMTRAGRLRVVNPLQGTSELWSRRDFEAMWDRLGRRALAA